MSWVDDRPAWERRIGDRHVRFHGDPPESPFRPDRVFLMGRFIGGSLTEADRMIGDGTLSGSRIGVPRVVPNSAFRPYVYRGEGPFVTPRSVVHDRTSAESA